MTTPLAAPFRISPGHFPLGAGLFGAACRALCERALGLPSLDVIYSRTQQPAAAPFAERALRALRVQPRLNDADVAAIPTRGPLLVIANHPFGGLDGLVLASLLQRVRPDARLLANHLLARIPEMAETCIFVDPFGGPEAAERNRTALRAAIRWLAEGGALGVFPAGEVSHFAPDRGCVTDPPWSDAVARLALRTRATVVPVYIDGRNSSLFQLLGLIHPRLRTAMLPRELLRRQGQTVRVEIGTPIPPERLQRLLGSSASRTAPPVHDLRPLTEYFRLRTYILKGRATAAAPAPRRRLAKRQTPEAITPGPGSATLAAEVAALPPDQCLATSGSFRVCIGSAAQIPSVLREIGRLRETTFRLVGEGTGRAVDLDRFDEHYLHLFVWNADERRVIGAYRIGQTDMLLGRFGVGGLYTSTLFRYQPGLLDQLTPALELGRSFVIPEYQRDYTPLLLLWKGIGRYVAMNPRYRRLFGAVSISDEFQSMTRQLLMTFLKAHSFDKSLARGVRPMSPPRLRRFPHANASRLTTLVSDVADVEELVGEIESNRRSVPVLLRQYLKLNARLLGFNVDSNFGDVLDGLVVVDLATVERPILARYMGAEGVTAFRAFHNLA